MTVIPRQRLTFTKPPQNLRLRTVSRHDAAARDADRIDVEQSETASAADAATNQTSSPAANDTAVLPLLSAIETAIAELEERRRQALGELRQAAVELAVAAASQVVRQAIDADEFAVEELVATMLARLGTTGPATIRLHPEDVAMLRRRTEERDALWEPAAVEIVADPALDRGCCRACTPETELMSDIRLHLEEVGELLREKLDDAQTERRRAQTGDRGLRRFPDRRETA